MNVPFIRTSSLSRLLVVASVVVSASNSIRIPAWISPYLSTSTQWSSLKTCGSRLHVIQSNETPFDYSSSRFSLCADNRKIKSENFFEPSSLLPSLELWLDLRGTAILPSSALSHLASDLWKGIVPVNDNDRFVDKVIVDFESEITVTEANVAQPLQPQADSHYRQMQKILKQIRRDSGEQSIILFAKTTGGDVDVENESEILQAKRSTFDASENIFVDFEVVGQTLTIRDDSSKRDGSKRIVHTDPLVGINALSTGKWLILDADQVQEEEARSRSMKDIIELFAPFVLNGAIMNGVIGAVPTSLVTNGGLAVKCTSNSDILNFGSLLQSLCAAGRSDVITTKGGIIWRKEAFDDFSISGTNSTRRKLALVLPFDSKLWRTASIAFRLHHS